MDSKVKVLIMDFGGSAIKFCLMDENGNQEGRDDIVAPRNIPDFDAAVKEICGRFEGQYEGISVSFPGFVQLDGMLTGGGAYPFFHGTNVLEHLKELSGCDKVLLENDGKCGALAEAFDGPLKDGSSGVVIILGTGVAGGLIMDRKLIKNKHCTAGELSGFCFDPQKIGVNAMAYSSVSGLTSMVAMAKGQLDEQTAGMMSLYLGIPIEKRETDHKYDGVHFDGKKVFEMIDEGDPDALAAYEKLLRGTAMLIYNMQVVFAPDKICIGGGITRQPRLVPDIKAKYHEILFENISPAMKAYLGDKADQVMDCNDADIVSCMHTGDANQYGSSGASFFSVLQPGIRAEDNAARSISARLIGFLII